MADTEILRATLDSAVEDLADIGWKRMFGCDAVFHDDTIFGLVWKEGRIGLKFTDGEEFESRMALEGSDRWGPGGRMTKHWILISETIATDAKLLKEWARISHESIL